jgi:hypothetical protein
MTSLPSLLGIPGELRNAIYELVIINSAELRLSEGRVTLPALGCVCRQTRTEMRGILEQHEADLIQAALTDSIGIRARVVNFDFTFLNMWLHNHELLQNETAHKLRTGQLRRLTIDLVVDVPLVDPAYSAESELAIKAHIARDREAIQSFNDSWDDSGLYSRQLFGDPKIVDTSGIYDPDEHGAKICGLHTPWRNHYSINCNVRLSYVSVLAGSSSGSFPIGFRHQGDYLDQLFGQTSYGGPWSLGYKWGPCASPCFKVVFAAMSRARSCRSGLSWYSR